MTRVEVSSCIESTGELLEGGTVAIRNVDGGTTIELPHGSWAEIPEGAYSAEEVIPPRDPADPDRRMPPYGCAKELIAEGSLVRVVFERYSTPKAQATEPPSQERRSAAARKAMAGATPAVGAAAMAAASLWILAPALWMAWFAARSAADEALGAAFAAENVAQYAAGYALRGWEAVSALSDAYGGAGAAVPCCLLSLVAGAVATLAAWRALADRPARNELLDSLPDPAGSNEHGSARIARKPSEIAKALDVLPFGRRLEASGIYLGTLPPARPGGPARAASSTSDEHVLIIGDTRAGKTRRILLETIDLITRCESESLIVIDPKGELFGLSSEAVRARGAKTPRIDLRYPRCSDRINPMEPVLEAARSGDLDALQSAVNDLVEMIVPRTLDVGPARFFNDGARIILSSTVAYVAASAKVPDSQRGLSSVAAIVSECLDSVPEDPSKPKGAWFVPYEAMLLEFPLHHPAVASYDMKDMEAKERKQWITTALTFLRLFRDSNIADLTSGSDFSWRQVGRERAVVYVIVPHEKETYSSFASLFIQQAYSELIDEATRHGGRLPVRVTMLCEEFGQVPEIPNLDKKLSASLGAGIRWVLVMQSLAQLSTVYGRDMRQTLVTNCNAKVLLKTGDVEETGRWFSSLIGSMTIETEGGSLSGGRFAPLFTRASTSRRLEARPVLLPDEVVRWNADLGALVHMGGGPGALAVPLPDVDATPTKDAFGLGTREENAAKIRKALFGGEKRKPLPQLWLPGLDGLDEGRTYDGDEVRAKADEFRRDLARAWRERLSGPKLRYAFVMMPDGTCTEVTKEAEAKKLHMEQPGSKLYSGTNRESLAEKAKRLGKTKTPGEDSPPKTLKTQGVAPSHAGTEPSNPTSY